MKKKLIIISLDALGDVDSVHFENLPGFKYLIDHGTYVKKVKSVYPSLTYPCHASIVSGRYPNSTRVVNNLRLQVSKKKMDWYWYEKDIEGDTIIRCAKRKGMKVAAVLWPVLAKGDVDYNIAEIIPHRPWHSQAYVSFINSSKMLLLDLEKKYGHIRKGFEQPQLDEFSEKCFLDILENKKPDMALCHYIAVDDKKHRHGTKSQEVVEAIKSYDQRIQNILKFLKDSGDLESTNLVVLSDHSHLDIKTGIRVNKYLDEKGYIKKKSKDGILSYKAVMQEAGGACYIYTNKMDEREKERLYLDLEELKNSVEGIEEIYHRSQILKMGADQEADFMLEAKAGFYFLQGLDGPLLDDSLPKHVATHGFNPNKADFSAVLFMMGPDFKNTQIERANLIDIAPTISKAMKFNLSDYKGHTLEEALKEETC